MYFSEHFFFFSSYLLNLKIISPAITFKYFPFLTFHGLPCFGPECARRFTHFAKYNLLTECM